MEARLVQDLTGFVSRSDRKMIRRSAADKFPETQTKHHAVRMLVGCFGRNDTSSIEQINTRLYYVPHFRVFRVVRNLNQPGRNEVSCRENPSLRRVADSCGIAAVQATSRGASDRGAFTGKTIAPAGGARHS